MSQKAGLETGQGDERNRNGHEILPKSRMTEMSKRPGLKRARDMNEIETGMKYCRKAECGECQKGLNISSLEVNQTESGQETMP